MAKIPVLKTFSDEWLVYVAQKCDSFVRIVGPHPRKTRSSAHNVVAPLAYVAWMRCEYGVYIMLIASEPWAAKRGMASRLLAFVNEKELGAPILALAVKGTERFWTRSGFTLNTCKRMRAALGGNRKGFEELNMYVKVTLNCTARSARSVSKGDLL